MRTPLFVRRVTGHSMEPVLLPGQIVVASGWLKVRPRDLVVVRVEGLEVIKRASPKQNRLVLAGERHGFYAVVAPNQVRGRVIAAF